MFLATRYRVVVGAVAIAAGAAMATATASRPDEVARDASLTNVPVRFGSSRDELSSLERQLEAELARRPDAGDVAARLAEVLLRRSRVEANGGYTAKAERALKEVLRRQPNDYNALRSLGAVRLSQHRFRQAIEVARRASLVRPSDAWNHGVLGDAHLELGEYEQAFDAFDRMVRLRPDAASYARVAYARELQGHLEEALASMKMAATATDPRDSESLAWHYAQAGMLCLQLGRLNEAESEFAHADFVFPAHPYARLGQARLAVARGDAIEGLKRYQAILAESPTSEVALAAAELASAAGDEGHAVELFTRAEALEREAWRTELEQPANLARILAERGVRTDEAVALAERASASRSDIFTMDALAWSYYRAGRLDDARTASLAARRTGTKDARIVAHAAVIDAAVSARKPASGE